MKHEALIMRQPNSCICNNGWHANLKCKLSFLCTDVMKNMITMDTVDTVFLNVLYFNASLVRPWHIHKPSNGFNVQINQFLKLWKRVRSMYPNTTWYVISNSNKSLVQDKNLITINTRLIEPPLWTSPWHKSTFQKLQIFDLLTRVNKRIIYFDNDIILINRIDELMDRRLTTPAMILHQKEIINSGVIVIDPYKFDFDYLKLRKKRMRNRGNDGSDQEMLIHWMIDQNISLTELPFKYNTYGRLAVRNNATWCNDIKIYHKYEYFKECNIKL